jgi:release factor glutamine methyltransferase
LCTGSGCIAIALASNVVETEILAIDRSAGALEIAGKNVEKHNLPGRITLLQSDLFSKIEEASFAVFDLIVSNPPYISAAEFEKLEPNVRQYEPATALLAGEDGLEYYRQIAEQALNYLADGGAIMVEIAYNQAEEVVSLFEQNKKYTKVTVYKDHLGHNRVVKAGKL